MSEACSDFELLAADIRRQPGLLRERIPYLRGAAGEACAGLPQPSRVYLVACGDGLSAALAASNTWEQLLGCPVEAAPAMTFSRYRAQNAGPGSLAVVISQSGQVVRVIEALACAVRRGLETLVVTNKPESPLRSLMPEGRTFMLGFERLGFTPGASAYTYTLAALYELAAALSPSEAGRRELREQIDRLPQALGGAVEAVWKPVGEFAGRLEKGSTIFILGSGPAYGTAHYSMRKLFEICQVKATLLETEEYAHDAYYALDAHTPVLLFAPPDAGLRRCVEIASYLAQVGCPLAVVSGPEQRSSFGGDQLTYIELPGAEAVEASLTYPVAGQALACLAGKRLGGAFYACDDPARYASGDAQIYESARMDLEDG
jgi:glucosamine--fructose-6-phosphate aminotransferase (isomerizing)